MPKPQSATLDRQGIQVIARAAAILRAIEREPAGLSLAALAARLDLPRSTVQRIVSALVDEGFLISAGPRAGFSLGPTLKLLGAATLVDTEKISRPVLQRLSMNIGETVDLSILRRDCAVFVDQVIGKSRLVAISAVGEAFPLYCTANGKALLGQLSAERRERLLPERLPRHTASTNGNRAALLLEIAEVQRTGVAWDIEEHALGICAVGTAFADPSGRLFALSIPVPTARFTEKREALARAILQAREEIFEAMPGAASADAA